MKQLLIDIFLVTGLNLPVFIHLYKHILKDKSLLVKAAAAVLFWFAALTTQTLIAFLGILYLFFAYYRKQAAEIEDEINIWNIDFSSSVKVVLMTIAARIGILLIHFLYIIILVNLVNYNIKPQDIIVQYSNASIVYKLLLAIEIVLIAPIVEEYVFRHFLYGSILSERMPKVVAAVLSASLFTALHFNISGIPTFFGLGLFCAYLYTKKGYWAAVIAHAASNLITLLLYRS